MLHLPRPGCVRSRASARPRAVARAGCRALPRGAHTAMNPARLAPVIGPARMHELAEAIRGATRVLGSRTVVNVNSTAAGGGVAELLETLLGYARGGGVATRWFVVEGDPAFFDVTKRIHNGLYGSSGDGGPLGAAEAEAYERTLRANARDLDRLVRPGDIVILHDPQTAGLAPAFRRLGATIVWRCHVGSDQSNEWTERSWRFLRPHLEDVDAFVFSSLRFAPEWVDIDRIHVILAVDHPVLDQEHALGRGPGARNAPRRRADRWAPPGDDSEVSTRERTPGRGSAPSNRCAGGGAATSGRAAGGPDLTVGSDEGHGGRHGRVCRGLRREPRGAPGPRRSQGGWRGGRPRGCPGVRGMPDPVGGASGPRPSSRPPGPPPDGRPRRECRDHQRAAAPRIRCLPEEPRRGVRADGRGGDVEGQGRRRQRRGWHRRPDPRPAVRRPGRRPDRPDRVRRGGGRTAARAVRSPAARSQRPPVRDSAHAHRPPPPAIRGAHPDARLAALRSPYGTRRRSRAVTRRARRPARPPDRRRCTAWPGRGGRPAGASRAAGRPGCAHPTRRSDGRGQSHRRSR